MIELPEAKTMAKQLKQTIYQKEIKDVTMNQSPHKFTFYYNDYQTYRKELIGKKITNIIPRCFYIEIEAGDKTLLFRDGVNLRYHKNKETLPSKHQMLITFTDQTYLSATVAMYGFLGVIPTGSSEDKYYAIEKKGIDPTSKAFTFDYFVSLINEKTQKLSAKAFLATEQRILGIGNGVVQDILWNAHIHPKTKISALTDKELETLFASIKEILHKMTSENGRDTEKDLFGNYGQYHTIMSKKNVGKTCPSCKENIQKETYLGGSIYYCPHCQSKK